MRFLFALVLAGPVLGAAPAIAQVGGAPVATPSPAPSATATPPARRRLLEQGRQTISIGFAPERNITSEFAPSAEGARIGWDLWQTGEQKVLGIPVISTNDYREIPYAHLAANPVTTVGGGGSTIVPSFQAHMWELESDGGIRVWHDAYVGAAMLNVKQNTGYPALSGIGYAAGLAPNAGAHVSPYGWVEYFPNVGGGYSFGDAPQTDLSYRVLHYRAGALIGDPHSRLALDLGIDGERMSNRTNAPATITDLAFRLGLATHF